MHREEYVILHPMFIGHEDSLAPCRTDIPTWERFSRHVLVTELEPGAKFVVGFGGSPCLETTLMVLDSGEVSIAVHKGTDRDHMAPVREISFSSVADLLAKLEPEDGEIELA